MQTDVTEGIRIFKTVKFTTKRSHGPLIMARSVAMGAVESYDANSISTANEKPE